MAWSFDGTNDYVDLTVAGNVCKTNWRGNMCGGFFENHGGVSSVNCINNRFE